MFYIQKLIKLKKDNYNFDFEIYLSREDIKWFKKWYITDFLTKENIKKYDEFYVCGISYMIDSTKVLLSDFWINSNDIFTEKY